MAVIEGMPGTISVAIISSCVKVGVEVGVGDGVLVEVGVAVTKITFSPLNRVAVTKIYPTGAFGVGVTELAGATYVTQAKLNISNSIKGAAYCSFGD